jgi:mycofactocin precursor
VKDHTAQIHPFPSPASEEVSADTNIETTDESLVHETLVEEVSIDGMCGVY